MALTLKQLKVFSALARTGNLAEAAEELFLSKGAVSMSLQEMEKQLEHALFDRVRNRLQLNSQGRQLVPMVDEVLERVGAIEQRFRSGDKPAGRLHIGASHTVGNYLLPAMVAAFTQRYPEAEFCIHIDNTRMLQEELLAYRLDMILVEGELLPGAIVEYSWLQDTMHVVAAPDHPLASREVIHMADLEEQAWLLRESGSGSREQFQRLISSHLNSWRLVLELNTTESLLNSVASGLGLCLLSRHAIAAAVAMGRVVPLPLEPGLQRQLRLALHKDKYLSPTLEAFVAFAREWRPHEACKAAVSSPH